MIQAQYSLRRAAHLALRKLNENSAHLQTECGISRLVHGLLCLDPFQGPRNRRSLYVLTLVNSKPELCAHLFNLLVL